MSEPKSELASRLAEPFDATEVKWKAQVVKGNRAMACAYVDARAVEDRLDQVFGVDGWQDSYTELPKGGVVCVLRVRIGTDWITKSDVGSPSEQPDEGDRTKAAFSDALKRAAVKLGIGRYLYRLPSQWVDYDPQKRQLAKTPALPAWACPKGKAPAAAGPAVITREQWEMIKSWLGKHLVSQRKFLEKFQVQKPGELPAARFQEALQLARYPPRELQHEGAPPAEPPRELKGQGDPDLRQPGPDEPLDGRELAKLEGLILSRGEDYAAAFLGVLGLRTLEHMPRCWLPGCQQLLQRHKQAEQLRSWQRDTLGGDAINDLPADEVEAAFRRGPAAAK